MHEALSIYGEVQRRLVFACSFFFVFFVLTMEDMRMRTCHRFASTNTKNRDK